MFKTTPVGIVGCTGRMLRVEHFWWSVNAIRACSGVAKNASAALSLII